MAYLRQTFPQHKSQETDQNMSRHAMLFLMPNRSQYQVAFLNSERLSIGQMNISLPSRSVGIPPTKLQCLTVTNNNLVSVAPSFADLLFLPVELQLNEFIKLL
jgi:hypothetical protein